MERASLAAVILILLTFVFVFSVHAADSPPTDEQLDVQIPEETVVEEQPPVSADEEPPPETLLGENPQEQLLSTRDFLPRTSYVKDHYTGAFVYTYDIDIPLGTNGLAPQISLTYASQRTTSSPSVIGTGWDFTQSYIQRDINGTDNTSNDKFTLTLEGSRHDLSFSDNRFHTRIETFLLIENITTSNNQKGVFWTVKDKSGRTYRFGFNNNSEAVSPSGNLSWKWYIDLVNDTYGNSVFYSYAEAPFQNDTNATYLSNITYNNDQARTVLFGYEDSDRPDEWQTVEAGSFVRYSRRLREINVTYNSSLVRRYVLEYNTTDTSARTQLANITTIGSDGTTRLPSTSFSYRTAATGYASATMWYSPACFANTNGNNYQGTNFAELNGDGLIDIIRAGELCDEAEDKKSFLNNGSGWNETPKWISPLCFVDSLERDDAVRLADVNGDGLTDILRAKVGATCYSPSGLYAYINLGNGSWVEDPKWRSPVCFTSIGEDFGTRLIDVNGDGLVDILHGDYDCSTSGNKKAYINNGSGWGSDNPQWHPPICLTGTAREDNGVRQADVNGDGLIDIIQADGDCAIVPSRNRTYINNGSGWVYASGWTSPICFVDTDRTDYGVRLFDRNGDGLVDIVRAGSGCATNPAQNVTYLNNGSGWAYNDSWKSPVCFIRSDNKDWGVRLSDFNGDGYTDIVGANNLDGCYITTDKVAYTHNNNQSYLLNFVRNSLGGTISIEYVRSTSLNNTGNDTRHDLSFNVWAVSRMTQNNSVNGSANVVSSYGYNYSGGLYDYERKEFRGFAYSEEIRPDDTRIRHYFHQDEARSGREYKTEILGSDNNTYQAKEFLWNYTANQTSFVTELREENSSSFDSQSSGRVSKMSYIYDQFGNPIEKYSHGETSSGDEVNETFVYTYNTTAWIVDKPSIYRLLNSTGTVLRSSNFSYNSRGSLTGKTDYVDAQTNATTSQSYDSFGNMINTTDPLGRITKYTYNVTDGTFTFPEREINARNQTTAYTYDFGLGKIKSVSNVHGFVTNYSYDIFGRISNEIRPLDSAAYPTKTYSYQIDGVNPVRIKTTQRENNLTNDTFDTYQFTDGFGNEILTKKESDNSQIITATNYDSLMRVSAKTNPYRNDFAENYTEPNSAAGSNFTYDPMDRIILVVNPDATEKSFNYTKWNVTTTNENGNRTRKALDAYGRIIKVLEYNGNQIYATAYEYDAAGSLVKIKDAAGNNFTFVYDGLGRKIAMTDPDMGTWNYTYDAAGNLMRQRDNRGTVTDFTYDELNRLTKKNSSSESFTYTYDSAINGTLSGVSGANYTSNYTYDQRLRKTTETATIATQTVTFNYTYDSMDRIKVKLLPDGLNITYSYNNQSKIQSIEGILNKTS